MERATGIEPVLPTWESKVPLLYFHHLQNRSGKMVIVPDCWPVSGCWIFGLVPSHNCFILQVKCEAESTLPRSRPAASGTLPFTNQEPEII